VEREEKTMPGVLREEKAEREDYKYKLIESQGKKDGNNPAIRGGGEKKKEEPIR